MSVKQELRDFTNTVVDLTKQVQGELITEYEFFDAVSTLVEIANKVNSTKVESSASISIDALGCPIRVTKILNDAGYNNVDDLFKAGKKTIWSLPGFGKRCRNDLDAALIVSCNVCLDDY